jgi:AraC family transcriptional regulator of adaptative response / DNA-3-methyladenine glycosylase II
MLQHLAYRPPLDWDGLLDFFRRRAIPGVELVEGDCYRRTIEWDGEAATLHVSPTPRRIRVEIRGATASRRIANVLPRVRRMFDLGADPLVIGSVLSTDPFLRRLVRRRPGLRVPGAWNAFETAVRAILGQQVTVRAATTFCGRLVERFGMPLRNPARGLTHLFPRAEALARADLCAIGLTRARAHSLSAFARAVAVGEVRLDSAPPLEEAVDRLTALPGIGDWTAQYIALRAFGEPDAFPVGDLGLRRALAENGRLPTTRELLERAEAWRPWRGYAAIHLWTSDAEATSFPLSSFAESRPAADARETHRRSSRRSPRP